MLKNIDSRFFEFINSKYVFITDVPKSKFDVISDLFPLRIENNWNSYFELLNIPQLIDPNIKSKLKNKIQARKMLKFCRKFLKYLEKEQPYNCAGSLKSEGLGIVLLNSIESLDTTALMGLPLIRLVEMLKKFDIEILNN